MIVSVSIPFEKTRIVIFVELRMTLLSNRNIKFAKQPFEILCVFKGSFNNFTLTRLMTNVPTNQLLDIKLQFCLRWFHQV